MNTPTSSSTVLRSALLVQIDVLAGLGLADVAARDRDRQAAASTINRLPTNTGTGFGPSGSVPVRVVAELERVDQDDDAAQGQDQRRARTPDSAALRSGWAAGLTPRRPRLTSLTPGRAW